MPAVRLRRLRKDNFIRDWVSQTRLLPKDLILPYFIVEGRGVRKPIKSMTGVYHLSIDSLVRDIKNAPAVRSVILFGVPDAKDETGSRAYKKSGIVQKAVNALKKARRDLVVMTDVCLCGYTSHGHCGVLKGKTVDNDGTLKILAKIAVSHAEAGADFVAPSAMMDGQVRAIRQALDKKAFKDTGILAYSAKYASNFYGPFREASDSAPRFGNRKTYQLDYRNLDEALREIEQDMDEGADMVMVKPALAYLDVICRAKQRFNAPIVAYNVSGEYSMVKRYFQTIGDRRKTMDEKRQNAEAEKNLILEILSSIKRAGADFIVTYWARDAVKWLK